MAKGLSRGKTLIEPIQDHQDDGRDDKAEYKTESTHDKRPLLLFFDVLLHGGTGGGRRLDGSRFRTGNGFVPLGQDEFSRLGRSIDSGRFLRHFRDEMTAGRAEFGAFGQGAAALDTESVLHNG